MDLKSTLLLEPTGFIVFCTFRYFKQGPLTCFTWCDIHTYWGRLIANVNELHAAVLDSSHENEFFCLFPPLFL